MSDGSAVHRRRRAGAGVAFAGVAAIVILVALALWPGESTPQTNAREDSLADPAESVLEVPKPQLLRHDRNASLWSIVRRPVTARAAPHASARAVASLEATTPEHTSNVLLILDRRSDQRGRVWVKARLPVLPNGTTGWLPRRSIGGYRSVATRLVVDLSRFRATLFRDGRPVMRADVGVGLDQWPTPTGRFYIRNRLERYRSAFYGPLAFGTSARSAVLTDWPGGGFVGIHGTNQPELLPGRVSHGCIRMRNADIVRLGRLMPVGTPMEVS
jgi:hypothetical protein